MCLQGCKASPSLARLESTTRATQNLLDRATTLPVFVLISCSCSNIRSSMMRLTSMCENPNREVGDASVQPTREAARRPQIPQPGRLGILHSSLQETRRVSDACYGWSDGSLTFRFGDLRGAVARLPVGRSEWTPTFPVGGFLLRFAQSVDEGICAQPIPRTPKV